MMKFVMGVLLCVLSCAIGFSTVLAAPPLAIHVTAKEESGAYFLEMDLANNGNQTVSLESSRLPWGWTYSTIVVASTTMGIPETLNQLFPVDDPLGEEVKVKPGEVIRGKIRLNSRFQNFAEYVQKGDIIVFWSTQPYLFNHTPLDRYGGWVLFHKSPH